MFVRHDGGRRTAGWRAAALTAAAATAALFLGGCGQNAGNVGGGAGGLDVFTPPGGTQVAGTNTGVNTNGVLRVDPATIDFGATGLQRPFEVHNDGDADVSFELQALPAWARVDVASGVVPAGGATTVQLSLERAELPSGNYSGTLTVAGAGLSPIFVTAQFSVPVGAGGTTTTDSSPLRVSPAALDFGSASETRSFLVRVTTQGGLAFTSTANQPWITLQGGDGFSAGSYQTVRVHVSRVGLTPGAHRGAIVVRAGEHEAVVSVAMTVDDASTGGDENAPQLYVSHTALNFGTRQRSLAMLVRNAGDGALAFTIQSQSPWFAPTVTSGESVGNYVTVSVLASRSGLAAGEYNSTLLVQADNGQSHSVALHMTVTGSDDPPGAPELVVSTGVLNFGLSGTALSFTLRNVGAGDVAWTITPDQAWVRVSPASGENAGDIEIVRATVDRDQLGPGQHEAALRIVGDNGQTIELEVLVDRGGVTGGGPVPPWPSSDLRVDALNSLQQYAIPGLATPWGYHPERWATTPIVYSVQVNLEANQPAPALLYEQVLAALAAENPTAVPMCYISAGDTRLPEHWYVYPHERIDYNLLPAYYHVDPYDWVNHEATVDLRNPNARALFSDLIVQEVLTRRTPAVYLDNNRHPHTGGTLATWDQVCEFLRSITTRLNEGGIKTVANLAAVPYYLDGRDADLFQTAVNGVTFEQPFHFQQVRGQRDRVITEINVYRQWLSAGMHITFWAADTPIVYNRERRLAEQRVLAAMVMCIRRPGDSLFVARPFFEDIPDWAEWPERFGPALGDYTITGSPPVVRREFQNATVIVDLGMSMDFSRSSGAVTVNWR